MSHQLFFSNFMSHQLFLSRDWNFTVLIVLNNFNPYTIEIHKLKFAVKTPSNKILNRKTRALEFMLAIIFHNDLRSVINSYIAFTPITTQTFNCKTRHQINGAYSTHSVLQSDGFLLFDLLKMKWTVQPRKACCKLRGCQFCLFAINKTIAFFAINMFNLNRLFCVGVEISIDGQ